MISSSAIAQTAAFRQAATVPDRNPPRARLTVIQGAQLGEVIFLRSRLCIFGRKIGILLRDALASRRHMQIYFDQGKFFLQDLRSSNGTYVNHRPVRKPVVLKHGDTIQVGRTDFLFEIPN